MAAPNIISDLYLAKILLMNYQGDIRIVRPHKELENYHQTIWTAASVRIMRDFKTPLLQEFKGNNNVIFFAQMSRSSLIFCVTI